MNPCDPAAAAASNFGENVMSVLLATSCFLLAFAAGLRAVRAPGAAMHPYPWARSSSE